MIVLRIKINLCRFSLNCRFEALRQQLYAPPVVTFRTSACCSHRVYMG
jgi:hypothetical protein